MIEEVKKIGENIKRIRVKKGYTQLDLAVECGMEESNIGRIENGNTSPNIKTLLKIAKGLGVSLSELVRIK